MKVDTQNFKWIISSSTGERTGNCACNESGGCFKTASTNEEKVGGILFWQMSLHFARSMKLGFLMWRRCLFPKVDHWRKTQVVTNLHQYCVELFYTVIDRRLFVFNSCFFTEVTSELLCCISCLNPKGTFSAFKKSDLIKLAKFYFSSSQLKMLEDRLETYIIDMHSDSRFSDWNGIGQLAERMVVTKDTLVHLLEILFLFSFKLKHKIIKI